MFKTGAICGTNSLRAFLNAGRSKSTIGDAEKNRASEMKKKNERAALGEGPGRASARCLRPCRTMDYDI